MLLLTAAERDRFAAWLEYEAESDRQMIEQMRKLSVPAAVIDRRKLEIAAALIIAKKLRETTSETL